MYVAVAAVYLALCFYWSPDWRNVDGTMWQPSREMMGDDVERAREVVGLPVAALWMLLLGVVAMLRRRVTTPELKTDAA